MPTNQTPLCNQYDAIIAKHSLLRHPFYVAWSEGKLPVPALKDYAREYGAFIAGIAQGWQAVGEPEIGEIEDDHARVWETSFAAALETAIATPNVKEVAELVTLSRELFADRPTAIGALYAFEAQQPLTAQSKLKGLRQHYNQLPESCGDYFRLHSGDYGEPKLLADAMETLTSEEQSAALAACEFMCQSLYRALCGIHAPFASQSCEMS